MASGWIDLVTRPIKIAFVVNPSERTAVQRAVDINNALWGGVFNPIIPALARARRNWQRFPGDVFNPRKTLDGYIDAFDPDYICPLGSCAAKSFKHLRQPTLSEQEIFPNPKEMGKPNIGIGLRAVADFVYDTEFKFIRSHPLKVVAHVAPTRNKLYLSAVHGCIPESDVQKHFRALTTLSCFGQIKPTLLTPYGRQDAINLIAMNRWGIDWHHLGSAPDDPTIYVLNPNDALDVIDFWNLRALGWQVLPTPIECYKDTSFCADITSLVISAHRPLPGNNHGVYLHALVLSSRGTRPDVFNAITDAIQPPLPKSDQGPHLHVSTHYPRIWDVTSREYDRCVCPEFFEHRKTIHFDQGKGSISVRTQAPEFSITQRSSLKPSFANVLRPRLFDLPGSLAEVIPPGGEDYTRSIGLAGWKEWHASRSGLVHIAKSHDQSAYFSLSSIDGEKMLCEHLKPQGLSLTPSSSGLMARSALQYLGHLLFSGGISSRPIITMLIELAKAGYWAVSRFEGELSEALNQSEFPWERARVIEDLIERRVITLGISIACPTCARESWHSISAVHERVHCQHCLISFPTPIHDTKKLRWSYRILGPFSGTNGADGIYPVLFTIRFLKTALDLGITACLSSEYNTNGKPRELDGTFLVEKTIWGVGTRTLCFLEGKTGNGFTAKEVQYMDDLGRRFPGSTLIFSTLADALSPKEQDLLRPVIYRNMRLRKRGRPHNDVLVLTGNELFASIGLHHSWERIGGRHKDIAVKTSGRFWQLADICESTNELYLNTPTFHSWMKAQLRQRINRAKPS